MVMGSYKTVEECIATFPSATQKILQKIRQTIKRVLPKEATEVISYGIPTFNLGKVHVIHFSGYKHHIGLYPGSEAIAVFADDLKEYTTSKGTVQFQLDEPIPYDLIRRIAEFRAMVVQSKKK